MMRNIRSGNQILENGLSYWSSESLLPPLARMAEFSGFLRANDIPVDTGSLLDVYRVAAAGLLRTRHEFKTGCRLCLCSNKQQWQRFDRLFDAFWQPEGELSDDTVSDSVDSPELPGTSSSGQRLIGMAGTSGSAEQDEEYLGAGDFKALSLADFRFVFDRAEMQRIEQRVEELARRAKRRTARRMRTASRGSEVDLRRSIRCSLRYQGFPVELRYRVPKRRLHRLVLLLDISQSMDVYARLFLRFVRILMTVFDRSEAFAFNTELIELGRGHRRLRESDFENALNLMSKGWLGGTKIAESLDAFNEKHLKRSVDSRTTVVVFSDGCDTARPERLAESVEIIQRSAGKLVWVNPLLGRYAVGQENRWMDPVVPFVDRYVSAHNLESLLVLERELLN
ncbi:MAG: VWA domain-containing protein [Granulosicoccus sp.]